MKLAAALMSHVYRLCWQVKLIFRPAKSVLRLHKAESENPRRLQSEIWARSICAVLPFFWHAQASEECWRRLACRKEMRIRCPVTTTRRRALVVERSKTNEPSRYEVG